VVQLERGGGTHVRPAGAAALNVKRASRTDGSTLKSKSWFRQAGLLSQPRVARAAGRKAGRLALATSGACRPSAAWCLAAGGAGPCPVQHPLVCSSL